jgi:hypothetical protein
MPIDRKMWDEGQLQVSNDIGRFFCRHGRDKQTVRIEFGTKESCRVERAGGCSANRNCYKK